MAQFLHHLSVVPAQRHWHTRSTAMHLVRLYGAMMGDTVDATVEGSGDDKEADAYG